MSGERQGRELVVWGAGQSVYCLPDPYNSLNQQIIRLGAGEPAGNLGVFRMRRGCSHIWDDLHIHKNLLQNTLNCCQCSCSVPRQHQWSWSWSVSKNPGTSQARGHSGVLNNRRNKLGLSCTKLSKAETTFNLLPGDCFVIKQLFELALTMLLQ